MTPIERREALRRYSAGEATLATLRRQGFGSYLTILGRLGEMGLKPPMAALDGEGADLRRRGREIVALRLRAK